MNPRKPLGVLALVAAVGAIAFPWVSDSDAAVAEASGPATKRVVVATAATARTSQTLRFSGVIRAKRDATLSFTAPGRVRQRWVEVGDRVEAGEKIAALDRRSAANRVAQAKTGVRQAKEQLAQGERDRSRADQLATERAASKVEVEAATHAVSLYEVSTDAASVELAEAQRMHRDGLLRAPFDGTIVSVASEAGEFVGAGQPVVTLSGDVLEVEVEVPETVLVDVAVGDAAAVSLPLQGDRTLQGHITSIGHGGRGAGRLFPVVVALPSEADLVPGMTADFVLERVGAAGVTVPVSAVVDAGGGETSVFAVENGVVQRRSVGVAQLLGADALIAKGVTAGDDIVSGGHFGLVPGQAVQVQR